MISVLFVDDEKNVLASIKRMLRYKHGEWNMMFADSGIKALALFKETAFDVIVSDIRMPGMDGAELLNRVRDNYPGVIRIALSGQVDLNEVMRSFRSVHQYISKPCDAESIVSKIDRTINLREILTDPIMQNIVTEIDSLPVLPKVFQLLEEELRRPEPSIQKIADLAAMDIGLFARILKFVNSPYFGLPTRIDSVAQAITMLGIDTIKALILSTHLFSMYDSKLLPNFSLTLLWDHSFRVANIARLIAECEGVDKSTIAQIRMVGLLHDVGKLVLATNYPEKYAQVFQMVAEGTLSISECEQAVFGTTHAHMGAYLMGLWGMPAKVVKGISLHHGYEAYDMSIPMIVSVANAIDHHCVVIHPEYTRPVLNPTWLPEGQARESLEKWINCVRDAWDGVDDCLDFDADLLDLVKQ